MEALLLVSVGSKYAYSLLFREIDLVSSPLCENSERGHRVQ